jgi:transcriptional regulator with XRE-family HTH domain
MMQNFLREIRLRRGMTQVKLAAAAGTTPMLISFIERYGHVPRADLRRRLARALGVRVRDIWPEASEEAEG